MRYALITALVMASVAAAGCQKKPEGPKTTRIEPPVRPIATLKPIEQPKPAPPIVAPEPIVEPAAPLPPVQTWKWYTVKAGDKGFYAIARTQLGDAGRWKQIRDLNPDVDSTKLRVGQKIKIPVK